MQSIAMGERLNSTQLKQKEEEFVTVVSPWKRPGGH